MRWALACELFRRGGRKRNKIIAVGEVAGRPQQLRDQNRREHGGRVVDA